MFACRDSPPAAVGAGRRRSALSAPSASSAPSAPFAPFAAFRVFYKPPEHRNPTPGPLVGFGGSGAFVGDSVRGLRMFL